jgi:site-specific DNA-cytosine methylase
MRMLDLFSGIGGFSLAASWVWGEELDIVAHVEINKQCREVLRRHWPLVTAIDDIRNVEEMKNVNPVDIVCGGDPCPIRSKASSIHKTKKHPDLSGYFLAVVGRCWPKWVVRENVPASDDVDFEAGLAILGYRTVIISTNAAPFTGQNRTRDFVVGCIGESRFEKFVSLPVFENGKRINPSQHQAAEAHPCLTTHLCRYDACDGYIWDGRGIRMATSKERIKLSGFPEEWLNGFSKTSVARMTGNCVVPQVAAEIFGAIRATDASEIGIPHRKEDYGKSDSMDDQNVSSGLHPVPDRKEG